MDEKITVFVMTYNRAEFLRKTLKSILNQTYKDFVLEVLDNCSTDNTFDVVQSFADPRVKYTRHNQNIGIVRNTQYAFDKCTTKYMVVFHDDDIMHEDFLEKQMVYMEQNSHVDILMSNAMKIDSKDNPIGIYQNNIEHITSYTGDEYIETYLNKRRSFIMPTAFYRVSFLRNHNIVFDLEVGPCADVTFFIDVCNNGGTVVEIDEPLIDYRIHASQESNISAGEMHCKLISYMNNSDKYRALMIRHKTSQNIYYYVSCKALLLDYIMGKIDKKYLGLMLKEYNSVIWHKREKQLKIEMIKSLFFIFPNLARKLCASYVKYKGIA